MIAVLGAGAMGAALGIHVARTHQAVLLATPLDGAVLEAQRAGDPHPALGLFHPRLPLVPHEEWGQVLAEAEVVIVGVSSDGLRPTLADAVPLARPDASWLIATKGWQQDTLESPAQLATSLLGTADRVVSLAGPGLAPEIAVGAPTALVCAGRDEELSRRVAKMMEGPTLRTVVTNDVVGAETASALKNVVAVAVGICEGFSERFPERAAVHAYANARAAVFAQGLIDMVRMAVHLGGRADTVLGLAGAGDVYVTCLEGRNGRFGRLLGAGGTTEQALRVIGSTVEGVPNCAAALALAARGGIELPIAAVVAAALSGSLAEAHGAEEIAALIMRGLAEGLELLAD